MSDRWRGFARVSGLTFGTFILLDLVGALVGASSRGWPGGAMYLLPVLAGVVNRAYYYLPVAALLGAVSLARSEKAGSSVRPVEVLGAAVGVAALSFVLNGYVGPHLFHSSLQALLPEQSRTGQANDWTFFLSTAHAMKGHVPALGTVAGSSGSMEIRRELSAMIHAPVAFALLGGLMVPLGLLLGRISTRFSGRAGRLSTWGMCAVATASIYGAEIWTWNLSNRGLVQPVPLLYIGYLALPVVLMTTLFWSAGMSWSALWPRQKGAESSGSVR